ESTGVLEDIGLVLALVDQLNADARVEEGQLTQTLRQYLVVELDIGEGLCAGLEANHRTALGSLTRKRQGSDRLAVPVLLFVHLAVAVNGELQILRERVHDRDADSVQAT